VPLHTRRRVIEAGLNDILGLQNKPKAAVQSVHKVTGPKKKKKMGLTPISSVFSPLFSVFNFAFTKICLYTVLPPAFFFWSSS